jgi:hypothetical protein
MASTVPLGRRIFLMIPGTSCLATIVLSLRDKNHPAIETPVETLDWSSQTPLGRKSTAMASWKCPNQTDGQMD